MAAGDPLTQARRTLHREMDRLRVIAELGITPHIQEKPDLQWIS